MRVGKFILKKIGIKYVHTDTQNSNDWDTKSNKFK